MTALMALPADYVAALEFIRDNTPSQAIVIDPQSMPYALTIPTVFIGERRVYLPTEYGEQVLGGLTVSPEVARRKRDFEQWSKDGFVDGTLSAQFASQADYCLLAGPGPRGQDWTIDPNLWRILGLGIEGSLSASRDLAL